MEYCQQIQQEEQLKVQAIKNKKEQLRKEQQEKMKAQVNQRIAEEKAAKKSYC